MNATKTCCDDACHCEGGTFTRLRYSYGQRLTAVDLLDEQAYLIAKDRFVARYALGAGILCGLRARRDGGGEVTPTLRVSRGAALDACGREIVVGADHCLDVAAWFSRHRDELGWNEPGDYGAWVGLRYRECPSDPVHLPGDPCGCDSGGCGYTRVHESFELALHADGGAVEPASASPGLCEDLAEHPGRGPRLAPAACPPCDCEPWMLVAAVDVRIDQLGGAGAGLRAVDVSEPVHDDPRRLDLHSLASLQEVVLDLAAAGGACATGPRIDEVDGDGDVDDDDVLTEGRLEVAVALGSDDDGQPVPLDATTVDAALLTLSRVGAGGWEDAAVTTSYDDAGAVFRLSSGDVELERPYRLALRQDPGAPIVDSELRPLRPQPWAATVRWVLHEDAVTLTTTS